MLVLTDKQYHSDATFKDYAKLLRSAENQLLFFSGNLTFSNESSRDKKIPGLQNVKNVLAINARVGRDAVEIRHCFQPLRATVADSRVAYMKEKLHPEAYAPGELQERLHVLYYVYDEDWVAWLQKIFWNFFRNSVDAKVRVRDLKAANVL